MLGNAKTGIGSRVADRTAGPFAIVAAFMPARTGAGMKRWPSASVSCGRFALEEFFHFGFQRRSEEMEGEDGGIPPTSFEARNIGLGESGPFGQLVLRQLATIAKPKKVGAHEGAHIGCHGSQRSGAGLEYLYTLVDKKKKYTACCENATGQGERAAEIGPRSLEKCGRAARNQEQKIGSIPAGSCVA